VVEDDGETSNEEIIISGDLCYELLVGNIGRYFCQLYYYYYHYINFVGTTTKQRVDQQVEK